MHYQLVDPAADSLRNRRQSGVGIVEAWVVTNRVRSRNSCRCFTWPLDCRFSSLLILAILRPRLAQSRIPWLQIGYAATFLTMAAFVIGTLISLYYDGVQDKSKASAVTLSQRLHDVVAFKVQFKDIEGLEQARSANIAA